MKTLTEKTLIPIGLAFAIFGGAAAWMTRITDQMGHNTLQIEQLKSLQSEYLKQVYEINSRLSRMEWKLEKKQH